MTISNTDRTVTAPGNGVTTEWPFTFQIPEAASVNVITTVIATGVQSIIDSADYTITGLADPNGGEVTYPTVASGDPAITSAIEITIYRAVPQTQEVSVTNQTRYDAGVVAGVWDRLTMMIQDLTGDALLSLVYPKGDTQSSALPTAALRANKIIAFDVNGGATVSTATISELENGATEAAASAAAALVSENAAAADLVLTNADVGLTGSDVTAAGVSEANAAASATAAAASAASNLFSKVVNKTTADSPYAVVADTDDGTMFTCTMDGNLTFTLPSIATAGEGERYGFLRVGASNTLQLNRDGTDTINGVAGSYTVEAADGTVVLVIADDASPDNWLVIPWSTGGITASSTDTLTNKTLNADGTGNAISNIDIGNAIAASQAEAEAGTDNAKLVTPLRVAQAVAALASSSAIIQVVTTKTNSSVTASGIIPDDTSTPTSSEGTEIFTASITPTDAANILEFEVVAHFSQASSGARCLTTLFQDAGASAIAVSGGETVLASGWGKSILTFEMVAGTTSATTFKVRLGGGSGTRYLNRTSTNAAQWGGLVTSGIKITERTP